jgi:tRNA threonylcarbamoyladenosine biosynthesis protein TsaB
MIICIETATPLCSVALCSREGLISLKESDEGRSHASLLTVFIESLLREAGIKAGALEAVAVSKGPGSFTGLRIGVSVAKGMAYASSIPLIGIETTLSMFHGFLPFAQKKYSLLSTDLFCPAMDARRMEIYYCLLDINGNSLKKTCAEVIDDNSFRDIPESARILFFGDGALKLKDTVKRGNTVFEDSFRISAAYMHKSAYQSFDNRQFEDVAYFEPFYLKDFLTSKPVKNILGH